MADRHGGREHKCLISLSFAIGQVGARADSDPELADSHGPGMADGGWASRGSPPVLPSSVSG
jgi:hypothetical protein